LSDVSQACTEYLEAAQGQVKRLQKIVQFEHEQRVKMEEMVEQLAKDQVSLETQAKRSMKSKTADNKDSGIVQTKCITWACIYVCFSIKRQQQV